MFIDEYDQNKVGGSFFLSFVVIISVPFSSFSEL